MNQTENPFTAHIFFARQITDIMMRSVAVNWIDYFGNFIC